MSWGYYGGFFYIGQGGVAESGAAENPWNTVGYNGWHLVQPYAPIRTCSNLLIAQSSHLRCSFPHLILSDLDQTIDRHCRSSRPDCSTALPGCRDARIGGRTRWVVSPGLTNFKLTTCRYVPPRCPNHRTIHLCSPASRQTLLSLEIPHPNASHLRNPSPQCRQL